ncbi:MAG: hypothetical protein H6581_05640 [Bacteroidia bacterium]|nr:hypothetical protein [Bacteroidia bacterium]
MSSSTSTKASTSTGEFNPGVGKAAQGGSIAVLGSTLYYFVPDSNNKLKICTCDVSGIQSTGDYNGVTSSSKWSDYQLNSKVSNSNKANFVTKFCPAVVATSSNLWFFWTDTHNNQVYAASFDGLSTWSATAIQLTTLDGNSTTNLTTSSSICANVFGDKIALNWFNTSSSLIHTAIFDPAALDTTNNLWQGTEGLKLDPSTYSKSVDSTYFAISTNWFSQGSDGNYLVASLYSSKHNEAKAIIVPIDENGNPTSNSSSDGFGMDTVSCSRGFTVSRDPAGRIYGICATNDSSHDLQYCTLNTFQSFASGAKPNLSWGTMGNIFGGTRDSQMPITTFFLLGNQGTGTRTLANNEGDIHDFNNCTTYVAYQFVLYADGSKSNNGYPIQCQVGEYGTSYVIPNYSSMVPLESVRNNYTLSMIFDPFPFPNQNIGSKIPGETVISYTYGATSETSNSVQGNYQILFGIKGSLSTTKGLGPALNEDFSTGPSSSFSNTELTKSLTGWSMNTGIVMGQNGQNQVSTKGRFDGHTLLTIGQTAAVFYGMNGSAVNGVSAPLFNSLVPVPGMGSYATSGTYDVFTANPGDIQSYSETNINATMAARYNALPSNIQALFDEGYATNYIENVISPNAVEISPGMNYLEFTISPNGGSQPSYSQIQEVFSSIGLIIQSSLYVGVGYGEEVSLFGLGESTSGALTAGFEYNLSLSETSTSTQGWGISSQYTYPNNVPGSYRYTVRMYICKPSDLWVNEIQYMATNVEDFDRIEWSSSAPLKIMFVVDGISLNS